MKNLKARVPIRYALFQIPGLILLSLVLAAAVRWWDLPAHIAYLIAGLWIVKDACGFSI